MRYKHFILLLMIITILFTGCNSASQPTNTQGKDTKVTADTSTPTESPTHTDTPPTTESAKKIEGLPDGYSVMFWVSGLLTIHSGIDAPYTKVLNRNDFASPPETFLLNVGENRYEGKFTITGRETNHIYPSFRYDCDQEGCDSFYINEEGELSMFCKDYIDANDAPPPSEDESIKKAKEFLSEFFASADISDRKITTETDGSRRIVYFRKYIGDIPTADCIRVYVTENGAYSFYADCLNLIPDDLDTSMIDMDKVNKAVECTIADIQNHEKNKSEYSRLEISITKSPVLIITRENELGFLFSLTIGAFVDYPSGGTMHGGEAVTLFIKIPQ